jgi:type IV secretion system protein VirB10
MSNSPSSGASSAEPQGLPPSSDELGIPGLNPRRSVSTQWRSLLTGGLMLLSMAAVLLSVVWNRFGPDNTTKAPDLPIAANQLPPLRLEEPQPRTASMAPASPPPAATSAAPAEPSAPPAQLTAATPVTPPPGHYPTGYASTASYAPSAYRPPRDDSPFVSPLSPHGTGAYTNTSNPHLTRTGHMLQTPAQHSGHPISNAAANLEQYQQQLDGMVRQLQTLTDQAQGGGLTAGPGAPAGSGMPAAAPPFTNVFPAQTPPARTPALFGQLERSQTPRAHATFLGSRSMVVPKGVLFQCALKTRIVSAVSGFVGCQVQRPVYSDDGKVVLIERGSHLDGEYRIVQVRPGVTRIPILWTRVRTPHGVTVDLDSPATGPLGDSGVTGDINNRWVERIGAALLLSLIDDAIKLQVNEASAQGGGNATVVLPNTAATTSRLAEKVLENTIHIPPIITAHQGSVVGVYVSRDLDFSGVYRLELR